MRYSPTDHDLIGGIRRALETNDVVITSPMGPPRISREQALTASYLIKRTVLFLADESHGTQDMVGNFYDGTVIEVDEVRKVAVVCYLYGHHSRTDIVQFKNLVAALDKDYGHELTIGRFSGPSIDLRT